MPSLFQFQSYSPATPPQQVLKEVFGYDSFRPLQEDIISSVLAGRDTIAIMPTGGGKSLCYQIPALMMEGITLVVSPLIALMQDQVSGLEAAGVPAVFLSSVLDREEYFSALNRIEAGEVKLVYMSPEGLAAAGGHDGQGIPSCQDTGNNVRLQGTERIVAKDLLQHLLRRRGG